MSDYLPEDDSLRPGIPDCLQLTYDPTSPNGASNRFCIPYRVSAMTEIALSM
jgi:hypothetical protein